MATLLPPADYTISKGDCPSVHTMKGNERADTTLVFVDCQFWGKEGKMKGSTKSQKMDEPFSS